VGPTVSAYLDLGRDPEVGLVKIFWGNLESGNFWVGRRRAKAAALDVFNFVVGDKVLRYTANREGKRLRGKVVNKNWIFATTVSTTHFLHETIRLKLVGVGKGAHETAFALFLPRLLVVLGPAEAPVIVFPRVLGRCSFCTTMARAALVGLAIE
jgi:hypothetical protein